MPKERTGSAKGNAEGKNWFGRYTYIKQIKQDVKVAVGTCSETWNSSSYLS